MITANVLRRTFLMSFGGTAGTCFTLDVDGRQYLVTARHNVEAIANADTVLLEWNTAWHSVSTILVGHGSNDADVTVLSLTDVMSRDLPLPSEGHYYLAQDLFFLGFPYDFRMQLGEANAHFPIPLVKKGILSAFYTDSRGVSTLLLDGHNNPGFSGGPVVYADPGTANFRVAGVVSGFEAMHEPVFDGGTETGLRVLNNTGIVVAASIKHALDAIRANPVGALL